MELTQQVVTLLLLALPVACIAWTVTHEEIFREPREYCVKKSKTCELYQEARYSGAIFDLYQDVEGQLYIGTEDEDKASTFGLDQTDEYYYSKYVDEDEIEKIIYRKHIE